MREYYFGGRPAIRREADSIVNKIYKWAGIEKGYCHSPRWLATRMLEAVFAPDELWICGTRYGVDDRLHETVKSMRQCLPESGGVCFTGGIFARLLGYDVPHGISIISDRHIESSEYALAVSCMAVRALMDRIVDRVPIWLLDDRLELKRGVVSAIAREAAARLELNFLQEEYLEGTRSLPTIDAVKVAKERIAKTKKAGQETAKTLQVAA